MDRGLESETTKEPVSAAQTERQAREAGGEDKKYCLYKPFAVWPYSGTPARVARSQAPVPQRPSAPMTMMRGMRPALAVEAREATECEVWWWSVAQWLSNKLSPAGKKPYHWPTGDDRWRTRGEFLRWDRRRWRRAPSQVWN